MAMPVTIEKTTEIKDDIYFASVCKSFCLALNSGLLILLYEGDCPENLCTNALCPAFVVKYLAQKADMHEIQARFLCADSNCCLRRCNAEPTYSQAGTGQLMLWLSSSDLAQFGCMQASTYMARVRPEQTKCLFF